MVKDKLEVEEIKGNTSNNVNMHDLQKEWDEVSCAICMDHPHNAVVLICASYGKGCRSYICDTSYRHSNCLDRFRKLRMNSSSSPDQNSTFVENAVAERQSWVTLGTENSESHMQEPRTRSDFNEIGGIYNTGDSLRETREFSNQNQDRLLESQVGRNPTSEESAVSSTLEDNCLKCPLCRGDVMDWMIVKEARQYMDQKVRSCSRESCSFAGNYKELRRHARSVHPTTRPAEVDPSRQRAWRRFVHQQEYGDIVSAIRSAMPGAVVFGDYVIDDGEGMPSRESNGPWLATLFLLHMISSPVGSLDERRTSSRSWRRRRRSTSRRYLWGENLLGLQDDDCTSDDGVQTARRRRRITRSRPENDQQQ